MTLPEPSRLHAGRAGRSPVPRAPRHLSEKARTFWSSVQADFDLETHHIELLTRACESLDRMDQARIILDREGLTTEGRFGLKARPEVAIERDSRIAFARLIRELGLDLEAPAGTRPPSRWHA